MALPNGYNQYMNSKMMTATPEQLIMMLYDGAIKFCNLAIMGIESSDIVKAHKNIMKVERIIDELRNSLDFNYPVAKEFENVYQYLYDRLIQANLKKDRDIMEEVLEHLRTMRETWEEVMKLAKQKNRA